MTSGSVADSETLVHCAYFYRGPDDYVRGSKAFVAAGLAAGERALVAVPAARHDLIRQRLAAAADEVAFLDITQLGRNPSRIIPAVREFTDLHADRPTRLVGEVAWPGRNSSETVEVTLHEALVNEALARVRTTILCLYDAEGLDQAVLADAYRTHPWTSGRGPEGERPGYVGADLARTIINRPLPAPPPDAAVVAFGRGDLPTLRRHVWRCALSAGLVGERAEDLVLAVNEAATGALLRATAPGTLRTWQLPSRLVCEVAGASGLTDPLTGRYPPTGRLDDNDGLWLVNQLCDLTELRCYSRGTTVRMHMSTGDSLD